jgi:hypothetical protein
MEQFILEVADYIGEVEEYRQYLIEAENEESVKEWFLASLEVQGYEQPRWSDDEYILENTEVDRVQQLAKISQLTEGEAQVMDGYISKWYKPAPSQVAR